MTERSSRSLLFLFSDIEGSTQLWERYPDEMQVALQTHDAILTSTIERHLGHVIKHTGDGIFAVFEDGSPIDCAIELQEQFTTLDWGEIESLKIRIALHLGPAEKRASDYFGPGVNRAARLLSAGWGEQTLLSAEVLDAYSAPEDAQLHDYGVHQLKDLGDPQHIFGVSSARLEHIDFPPLKTLSSRLHNLPIQTTPFVGRERELQEIHAHIAETPCRLLTLLGSGGIGKTRLAVQTAAEAIDAFEDGVYFVSLASISSADFLLTSIAEALKFSFFEEQDPEEQLIRFLSEKKLLLVLDNFEHIIEGASIVARILQKAPEVKLLITSRERLNIQGEWVYPLYGLEYPLEGTPLNLETYSAVALFLEGAQRVQPGFQIKESYQEPIIQICDLVHGIPLGIELASAWCGLLTPIEIASEINANRDFLETQLQGMPERHRSLRAVFDYSWKLLTDEEREVYQKLSVFRGGFSLGSAREVANASMNELASLANKSLIRRPPSGRFEMIEALRNYAEEKLKVNPSRETAIREAHALYFLSFLAEREARLAGENQTDALEEIGTEIENIRIALDLGIAARLTEQVSQALNSLTLFYEMRSWFKEGEEVCHEMKQRFESQIEQSEPDSLKRDLLARVLSREGGFSHRLGMNERAKELLTKSAKLHEQSGNEKELALAFNNLGNVALTEADDVQAKQYHTQSLELRKRLGDTWGIANSLSNLGVLETRSGQLDRAKEMFLQSLSYRRETGDQYGIASSLNNLGVIDVQLGDFQSAQSFHDESLSIRRQIGDQKGITESLNNLGVVANSLGNYSEAVELYEESVSISEGIGDKFAAARTLNNLGYAAYNAGNFHGAIEYCQRAADLNRSLNNESGLVLSLTGLANAQTQLGELDIGRGFFKEALSTTVALKKSDELHDILLGFAVIAIRSDDHENARKIANTLLSQSDLEDSVRETVVDLVREVEDREDGATQFEERATDLDSLVKHLLETP